MKTIAVASGKGGRWETNMSVNLALALAEAGTRCLLLDADMGLANVDVVLGVECPYTLLDVIENERTIDEV